MCKSQKNQYNQIQLTIRRHDQEQTSRQSNRSLRDRYNLKGGLDGSQKTKSHTGAGIQVAAAKKLAEFPDPEQQLGDFHEAVRTRKKFALNEANGHRSCTIVNLGKIALRLGRPLRYNPENQEFIHDAGANELIDQPMRDPWTI